MSIATRIAVVMRQISDDRRRGGLLFLLLLRSGSLALSNLLGAEGGFSLDANLGIGPIRSFALVRLINRPQRDHDRNNQRHHDDNDDKQEPFESGHLMHIPQRT